MPTYLVVYRRPSEPEDLEFNVTADSLDHAQEKWELAIERSGDELIDVVETPPPGKIQLLEGPAVIAGVSPDRILGFIYTLQDAVPRATEVFEEGNCFQLWRLLCAAFPETNPEPYYDGNHVVTLIGNLAYDIRGCQGDRQWLEDKRYYPLRSEPRIFENAYAWRYEG